MSRAQVPVGRQRQRGKWLRSLLVCLLLPLASYAVAQDNSASAADTAESDDSTATDSRQEAPAGITEMGPVHVTAPRLRIEDLYVSKPPVRTPPTVFDKAWREPLNLKKIGEEGGVVPLLVRYTSEKVAQGPRKIPGWKQQVQGAVARPPPLSEAQMQRASRLQTAPEGQDHDAPPP